MGPNGIGYYIDENSAPPAGYYDADEVPGNAHIRTTPTLQQQRATQVLTPVPAAAAAARPPSSDAYAAALTQLVVPPHDTESDSDSDDDLPSDPDLPPDPED